MKKISIFLLFLSYSYVKLVIASNKDFLILQSKKSENDTFNRSKSTLEMDTNSSEITQNQNESITSFEKKPIAINGFYNFISKIGFPQLRQFIEKHDKLTDKAWKIIDHNENNDLKKSIINEKMESLFKKEEYRKEFIDEWDKLAINIDEDFKKIPQAKYYDKSFSTNQKNIIDQVAKEFKPNQAREHFYQALTIDLDNPENKDLMVELATDVHSSPFNFIKSLDELHNKIPFEKKIIINTGDLSGKPDERFKNNFSILSQTMPLINRLKTFFLSKYSPNFIFIKGNHETKNIFMNYAFYNYRNQGNSTYTFLDTYFKDHKKNFYSKYLDPIDRKTLALFLKITVKKNNKILYQEFYNHSPILTEPIFSETANESGINGMKKLRFHPSHDTEDPRKNPYYSPCFLNKNIKNNDSLFENKDLNGFGFYCISCRIDNFDEAKWFIKQTIGSKHPFFIRGGHDHTGKAWMCDCIKKNKFAVADSSGYKLVDSLNYQKGHNFNVQPPFFKNIFGKYILGNNETKIKVFEEFKNKCKHPYNVACVTKFGEQGSEFVDYIKYGMEHNITENKNN